jgi:muconate cycloisomerase
MLLGGRCRDAVGACAVLPLEKSIEESVEAAQIFYERGFRSFTVKVGVYPHLEVNLVAALRKRFDDVLIRVDANASLGFDAALALMKKLEPYQIDAAEQMIALWDLDGMADLSRRAITRALASLRLQWCS